MARKSIEKKPVRFALPARLVRGELVELRDTLLEQFSSASELIIDAVNVLEIDGAGLQLLMGLFKSAKLQSTPVSFAAKSAALEKSISDNRVGDIFGV